MEKANISSIQISHFKNKPNIHSSRKIIPLTKSLTTFEVTQTKSDYFINSPYYWYYKEVNEVKTKKLKPRNQDSKLREVLSKSLEEKKPITNEVLSKSLELIEPTNNETIENHQKISTNAGRKSKFHKLKIIYKALKRKPKQIMPKNEDNASNSAKPRRLTLEQIKELSISEKFINDAKKMLFSPATNSFIPL